MRLFFPGLSRKSEVWDKIPEAEKHQKEKHSENWFAVENPGVAPICSLFVHSPLGEHSEGAVGCNFSIVAFGCNCGESDYFRTINLREILPFSVCSTKNKMPLPFWGSCRFKLFSPGAMVT